MISRSSNRSCILDLLVVCGYALPVSQPLPHVFFSLVFNLLAFQLGVCSFFHTYFKSEQMLGNAETMLDMSALGCSKHLKTRGLCEALRGYALILTHPGVPCVFHWDYVGNLSWGSRSELKSHIGHRHGVFGGSRHHSLPFQSHHSETRKPTCSWHHFGDEHTFWQVRAPYVREKLLELCWDLSATDSTDSLCLCKVTSQVLQKRMDWTTPPQPLPQVLFEEMLQTQKSCTP